MGEKFAANPVTGTGSITVPIATSPGRSGFGPQLSLSYDSGAGNGPFGFGWSLSLPQITRKTEKGLPRYFDGHGPSADSDTFMLSGSEDLVPEYERDVNDAWVMKDGQYQIHENHRTANNQTYRIRRYRPRIEGLFARIERWSNTTDATDVFWRSISKDNITTWYGKTAESRIQDPADPTRIFCWLICQTHDDKGNVLVYGYKREDSTHVDLGQAHERNRTDQSRSAQRYLKRIRYGNRSPYFPELKPGLPWPEPPGSNSEDASQHWLFETVFDYDEPHYQEQIPNAQGQFFATASAQVPQHAAWPVRHDPFSSYRAGFEVRTYRLCQRVLMFHHFPGEANVGKDCLVRATDFTYDFENNPENARVPIYSFLTSVTQSGYVRRGDHYLKKSLPSVEFTYSKPEVQDIVEEIDSVRLENLPIGLDGSVYQWTDLHGEGIPGILTEQGGAWYYKRNWSPIPDQLSDGSEVVKAKFSALETVALKPNVALNGGAQLMDLAGDGQPDVVAFEGPAPGLYEHDSAEGWEPFRPFTSRLNRDMQDPNLKFVDLDGDGHADVLITEDDAFVWHPSLAEEGFGPAHRVSQHFDEEKGPRMILADGTQSIYLADLSGDGLTDLVRIRNGEVCYWPNLGYGHFGAKVTMDNAPYFDHPDQFDQKRIRLADIDGSGTTDIIYLHRDGVRLCFNQSGNGWSEPRVLSVFPKVDDLVSIVPTDLLGNGTACLVWSSPLPSDSRRQMRYVNLMGEQKPHLLVKSANNLGAETEISYAPSTKFYLADKLAGRPWITKLPFPVHVVEQVTTYDHISDNRFVTRYAYRHGYFDGREREFRGFGMVEQWDTETFTTFTADGKLPKAANLDAASHVPPIHTKTWFHTGVYLDRQHISHQFEREYYPGSAGNNDQLLPDTTLDSDLTLEEEREACRALKGMMLRQEVYADDASSELTDAKLQKAKTPYTVLEQDFTVRRLQRHGGNRHAVLFAHPREAITYHYERNAVDPRVQHALTLQVDDFGNVCKSAAIGYGRRFDAPDAALVPEDRQKQRFTHITCTENEVTSSVDGEADAYRTPLPAETRTYELRKPAQETSEERPARFQFNEILAYAQQAGDGQHEIDYEDIEFTKAKEAAAIDPTEKQKYFRRLIEHIQTRYRKNNLTALLPLGKLESMALPGETYKLAFTPGLLAHVFQRNNQPLLSDPGNMLVGKAGDQGGYVTMDGNWWIPSGRSFFDPNANIDDPASTAAQELNTAREHFYLPRKIADSFSHNSRVDYDVHNLLVSRTTDAVGNTVAAVNDYRVLQPSQVTDPNGNRTRLAFDVLALVVATGVMGKPGENMGDLLEGFDPDPPLVKIQEFVSDWHAEAASLLGKATTRVLYDLDRYQRSGQPSFAVTLARETHFHDAGGAQTKIQVSFSYSDGLGRVIQKKIQAEAGESPQRQANVPLPTSDIRPGDLIRDAQGKPVQAHTPRRWVGAGRTVFNNKGKPVKQYEPFFSSTHLYESEQEMTDTGVSPILFYDPLERVVATLHPNHTYEKVVFDPWSQTTYDVNDTVLSNPSKDDDVRGFFLDPDGTLRLPDKEFLPTWHGLRTDPTQAEAFAKQYPSATDRLNETIAATKASAHAQTPATAYLDTLGRSFLTVSHNKVVCPAHNLHNTEAKLHARVELDIEGNQRSVRDADTKARDAQGNDIVDERGRTVMRYECDMLGNRLHQASMEAGERWMLNDVNGKPIRAWDSRGFVRRMTYDELRRPTGLYVIENGTERLAERTTYGESQGEAKNHRTRLYQVFDNAGVVTNEYDFKGNIVQSARELLPTYKQAVDWEQDPVPNGGTYASSTTYDALNRPVALTTPDNSVTRPTFNEANLLNQVQVQVHGTVARRIFVHNIDYDAKGQRTKIEYNDPHAGTPIVTEYAYDDTTFRLTRLRTTRPTLPPAERLLQDLNYIYDPVGNITSIRDDAQQTIYFNGQVAEPHNQYTYDAMYRLIKADGREHIGQVGRPVPTSWDDRLRTNLPHPYDGSKMRRYEEQYDYDDVGNILQMIHIAANGNWTRGYRYVEPSLLEPASKKNNRLSSTQVGNNPPESYAHDPHGNMNTMPHLSLMKWDYRDQLLATTQQSVNNGMPETTYYVYDSAGQRVRKVTELANGNLKDERIYLNGLEVYRQHSGAKAGLVRETLHIMDDKQRIALVETRNDIDDGTAKQLIRYQFGNHLGSAMLEVNDRAEIISYEEYFPYGSTAYQGVRSQTKTPKRFRYTGKERDEESGLYYHGARYYAPWIGRWSSSDPAQLEDGVNLYTYVHDNPLVFMDPNGKAAHAGHYRSVYLAALVVGYEPDVAAKMAFYAQMPDQVKELDAAEAGKNFFLSSIAKNAGSNMKQAMFENAVTIQAGGHSITGDVAEFERNRRREIVLSQNPGSALHGAALHAFSDAFFHERETVNRMVKPPMGHGPFTEFDLISRHPDRWEQSFRALIDVLGKQAPHGTKARLSEKEIDQMIREIKSVAREWRGTPGEGSEAGVRQALESWTNRAAGGGDFWLGLLLTSRYEPENEELMTWNEFRKVHSELTKDVELNDVIEAYKTWAGPMDQSYQSVQIDHRQLEFRLEGSFKFPILSPVDKY
jgi:RHS repeat-associated protein